MKAKKLKSKVLKLIDSKDNFTSVAILNNEMEALIEIIAPLLPDEKIMIDKMKKINDAEVVEG